MLKWKQIKAYVKHVGTHKWWVLVAGFRLRASLWRLLLHDLSKFRPSEFIPYASAFYSPAGETRYLPSEEFQRAWLKHQRRNKHHWQYWTVLLDHPDEVYTLRMPERYVREMVADWAGAGRAIHGHWDLKAWFDGASEETWRGRLHPSTYNLVRWLVDSFETLHVKEQDA